MPTRYRTKHVLSCGNSVQRCAHVGSIEHCCAAKIPPADLWVARLAYSRSTTLAERWCE